MTKQVDISELKSKLQIFLKKYFDNEAARLCHEVIMYAEMRNKNGQGLLKLIGTEPLQDVKPTDEIQVQERRKISATVSGNGNPSFAVAQKATETCLEKAKESGFGIVGANGIFSSTGALGFYSEKIAKEGLIGFCCARSPGATAPFGTNVPLFGTNPFSWALPTQSAPVVFDMATSAITFYELVMAKVRGDKIPEGLAVNKKGELTTDPSEAMSGGILPFDKGYKGSALSMIVEVLSGPLVGASFCDYKTFDKDWGFLVFAIDPELLVSVDDFKKETQEIVDLVRSHGSPVPGDNGRRYEKEALDRGTLPVDAPIVELLGL